MRQVTEAFRSEVNKQANQPLFLYEIPDYDDAGGTLRLAETQDDSGDNIIWNGETWQAFPITSDIVTENSQGQVDTLRIRLGNVSRLIESYLHDFEWHEKKVTIYIVFRNQLNNSTDYISDSFYIDSYTSTEETVEFVLTTKYDALQAILPSRKISRVFCAWRYGSVECGHSGSSCDRTLAGCRNNDNTSRFGGQPGVPTQRI